MTSDDKDSEGRTGRIEKIWPATDLGLPIKSTPRRTRLTIGVVVAIIALIVYFVFSKVSKRQGFETRVRTTSINGAQRKYALVLPPALNADRKYPLVYAMHGMRGTEMSMVRGAGWGDFTRQRDFILVSPRSFSVPQPEREAALFDHLVTKLSAEFPVDQQRIYVIAMSKGCERAQWIAQRRPEKVAALVLHSGFLPARGLKLKPDKPKFPVLILVGEKDSGPFRTSAEEMRDAWKQQDHPVTFHVVPKTGHRWKTDINFQVWQFLRDQRAELPVD